MFDFLTSLFTSQSHKKNAIPQGQRVYAVGDIHGCDTLLDDLLVRISNDIVSTGHKASEVTIVFLGDYIDRGSGSPQVLERLIGLQSEEYSTIFLKGNHEASLLKFLGDPETIISWLDWGGDETLKSYGLKSISAQEPQDLAVGLKNAMPPRHLTFLQTLMPYFQLGDFVFAHAGIKPGVLLEEQSEHDLLWIRDEFQKAPSAKRPTQTIVHGHTAARKIVDKGWRVCVDSGAVWTGALTAVVLEGTTRRFISTDPANE